jgi:hypothetical protein
MSTTERDCGDTGFAVIGKARDESYAAGYSAGRDDAARLNVQSVEHVTKLHPETLRALGMFLLFATGSYNVESAAEDIDALLAKLEETQP